MELEIAREKAESAHIKKSQYLKAVSHDLMQPLEAARLFTSALASQPDLNDNHLYQIANINDSLKVANDLLSNLSEIARIESGTIMPQIESFPLKGLFDELARDFSVFQQKQQVMVRFVQTQVWVKSDRHLLRRILQNLIGNAIRYAAPGKVLIGVRRVGSDIAIQVLDNGPGIPKDKQSLVFEQFTQLHTATEGRKGLGLGLNISKSLSAILGHPLSLKSREGLGCNFTVQVPQAVPITNVSTTISSPQVSLQGVTVLCVDNDKDVLKGMIELLKSWHCEVVSAHSTITAKQQFDRHKDDIAIALLDYQLENERTGIELIAELRRNHERDLPAILITATNEPNIEQKAKAADMGFMRKLVKPAALRAMMNAKLTTSLRKQFLE